MFTCTTSVGRRLALGLALAFASGPADARANVEPWRDSCIKAGSSLENSEKLGSDLLFYRPLMAGQTGPRKPSRADFNEVRRTVIKPR